MAAMFMAGKTLAEIGELYGVTRERVRQLVKKHHGLVGSDGGSRVNADRRRAVNVAKKDAKSIAKHGCTHAQYLELLQVGKRMQAEGFGFARCPTGAFASQRMNALRRGISWDLKLWDWWQIWQRSGKWEERGRSKGGYVMCRFGDVGAYEVGNVYIATTEHNASHQPNNPYRVGHPDHEEAMAPIRIKLRDTNKKRGRRQQQTRDLPVGVTRRGNKFQAQIYENRKANYLGTYETPELAHAAYLEAAGLISERTDA